MTRHIQVILFICLSLTVSAQKEWSNWYFNGRSLLTFKHGYAEPVSDFVNPVPPFTDWYNFYNFGSGGISYSDPLTGNMKLIVSNRTAFSSNYEDMPNDNFIKSCPDKYSYHIIPFHSDKNKFYILQFQSAFADLYQHESGLQVRCPNAIGLAYTIVDLSLNNGQGDYYKENTGIAGGFTNLITTVRHANGKDVWVIVHQYNSNQYSAILITDDGFQPAVNVQQVHTSVEAL